MYIPDSTEYFLGYFLSPLIVQFSVWNFPSVVIRGWQLTFWTGNYTDSKDVKLFRISKMNLRFGDFLKLVYDQLQ